ncbi:MAG: DUF429 domain-containing protein [Cyanobacteriota bacterium]
MAERREGGYELCSPVPVREPAELIPSLLRRAGGEGVLLGLDVVIGLPQAYGERAGIDAFLPWLQQLGQGRWARLVEPAALPEEVCLERPFYPLRPGGARQLHLVEGLGVGSMAELLRVCERGEGQRRNACPLFWTLGANQVGRAALCAWREVLLPALANQGPELGVWPFDGALAALLESRRCVVAEAYPAEACVALGLGAPGRGWSKRLQADRQRQGPRLLAWAEGRGLHLAAVEQELREGFGAAMGAEDRFDSLVGLLGMVAVVLGELPEGPPQEKPMEQGVNLGVEGWILGHPWEPA